MENIKWFINQGVAVAALVALLYIEYKRAGGISKMPEKIEKLTEEVKSLKEQINKKQEDQDG
ncbi:MAG: hypothetical protein ACRCXX_12490 [Cetobacterium sp.]|uniref:hypothetical protein n=1 Tax=Bacteria TaxID=2 RepID=UPI003EE452DF